MMHCTKFHPNGNLWKEYFHQDDKEKPHGMYCEYDENEKRTKVYNYFDGIKNGICSDYKNGNLICISTFEQGIKLSERNLSDKRTPISEFVYDKNQNIIEEVDYELFLTNRYYSNGNKRVEKRKKDTIISSFYKNEKKRSFINTLRKISMKYYKNSYIHSKENKFFYKNKCIIFY